MTSDILITKTNDEPGATTLSVEAPVGRVQAAEKKAAAMYAKRVRIKGFRKGKAPMHVIQRRFGDAIKEAVVQELVRESWKLAIDQESLEPLGEPQIRDVKLEDGAPLTFEFLVETKPELTLDRIGGFALQRKLATVHDDVVDDHLDELRRKRAPWIPLEGKKPKAGQLVQVSIATIKDGEEEEDQSYDIVIGSDQALPEIEDKIMGLTPGESTVTTMTFPQDAPDESKRGQTITARISLHEVKEQQLPELDDGFAREVGDFDSVAALRAAVREDLEKNAKREADAEVRRQLIEQLVVANGVPAPQPLVQRLLHAYREAYQIPKEQGEQFAAEFGPVAESQVKRDLILDHIAKTQDLNATEDDIDERVEEIAKNRGMEPGKIFATLQKEKRIKELERNITEEKVFAFLLEQSTVTES